MNDWRRVNFILNARPLTTTPTAVVLPILTVIHRLSCQPRDTQVHPFDCRDKTGVTPFE